MVGRCVPIGWWIRWVCTGPVVGFKSVFDTSRYNCGDFSVNLGVHRMLKDVIDEVGNK